MIIARSYDMGIAMLMESLLIREGLDIIESTNAGHVSIAGADHSYNVQVNEGHAGVARRILTDNGYEKFIVQTDA